MVGNYSCLFKHYAGHNILNVASLQPWPDGRGRGAVTGHQSPIYRGAQLNEGPQWAHHTQWGPADPRKGI